MKPYIRLGIIGVGTMGSEHCRNILNALSPEVRITAAADLHPERRAWVKETLPGAAVFSEGSELIKAHACEAVLIATPHYDHPRLAVEAFSHGLHVLVEKPAGVIASQVRRMNEEAALSGKVFAIMYNKRTNCVYRKLKEMLVSGEYGAVRRLSWSITDWFRTQSYYDSNAWRATWDGEGGGVLMNQCPHQLDLLQWLCGMPVKIRAFCHEGKWHHIEVEDDVTAYMEFMNGATGVFVASTGEAPGINRLEIVTNHAKIVCENNQIFLWETDVSLDSYIKTSADPYQKPSYMCSVVGTDGENAQHTGVINAFAANILRGEPLIADGREGIYMVQLANAIYLSAWTDSTVCIPMNECLFEELLAEKRAQSKPKHVKETFRLSDHRNTGALSP